VVVRGAAEPSGKRMQEDWRAEHRNGEEQVAFYRATEERQSSGVGHHQPVEAAGIHIGPGSPSGKIADQEERDGAGKSCAYHANRAGLLAKIRAQPQDGGIPGPGNEMIPSQRVGIDELSKYDVGGGKKYQRYPHLAA